MGNLGVGALILNLIYYFETASSDYSRKTGMSRTAFFESKLDEYCRCVKPMGDAIREWIKREVSRRQEAE